MREARILIDTVLRNWSTISGIEAKRNLERALDLLDATVAENIEIDGDEDGFHLVVTTDTGAKLRLRIADEEQLYDAAKREIGPWLYERDQARATMTRQEEDAYDLNDPKHPRHHDVFAAISDTKEDA